MGDAKWMVMDFKSCAWLAAQANIVHEVARSFSNAGTNDSSTDGPQHSPHSPIHLALPLAWDCNEKNYARFHKLYVTDLIQFLNETYGIYRRNIERI